LIREEILAEVAKCVNIERNSSYGEPKENFSAIADFWNTYLMSKGETLKNPLNATDVSILMSLLKVARIATGDAKIDNFIDLAGYAVCGGEVATE